MVTALRRKTEPRGSALSKIDSAARRRRKVDIPGLLMVVAAVLLSVTINERNGTDVLVVSRALAVGDVINAADLHNAKVTITGQSVSLIAASDEPSVLGRVVAVPLVPGAPLVRDDLGNASSSLPYGLAVVPVPISVKQLLPNLGVGDHVLVVDTGTSSGLTASATGGAAGISVPATVVEVRMPSTDLGDTTAVVSLQLDRSAVADVLSAAAAGHVSLALVPAEGT